MNIIRPLHQFFARVKKFVQEESMHGLSNGIKLGVAEEDEMVDQPVFQACEEFRLRDRVWEEGNTETASSQSKGWSTADHWQVVHERNAAIENVIAVRALGVRGLVEKYKVLEALVRSEQIEKGTAFAFSLELLDNYNSVFLKTHFSDLSQVSSLSIQKDVTNGSQVERNWKSDMQKFFKSGWIKSLHSHF
jgi:hypothetical protein